PRPPLFDPPRRRLMRHRRTKAAPYIDAGEQEQPHHVDKVPIPGGRLEAEMLLRREVPRQGAEEADRKEDGPDYDVETVKSRRHEERGAVDRIAERERCVDVLISLHAGK